MRGPVRLLAVALLVPEGSLFARGQGRSNGRGSTNNAGNHGGHDGGESGGESGRTCGDVGAQDLCYEHILWAKTDGIHAHPEWYPGLNTSSTFAEFQCFVANPEYDKPSDWNGDCDHVKPPCGCLAGNGRMNPFGLTAFDQGMPSGCHPPGEGDTDIQGGDCCDGAANPSGCNFDFTGESAYVKKPECWPLTSLADPANPECTKVWCQEAHDGTFTYIQCSDTDAPSATDDPQSGGGDDNSGFWWFLLTVLLILWCMFTVLNEMCLKKAYRKGKKVLKRNSQSDAEEALASTDNAMHGSQAGIEMVDMNGMDGGGRQSIQAEVVCVGSEVDNQKPALLAEPVSVGVETGIVDARQSQLEKSGKELLPSPSKPKLEPAPEPEPEPEPEPPKSEEEEEADYRRAFAGFRSAAEIEDVGEIVVERYLSKGTSGTVSKAKWRGMDVAVKEFFYVADEPANTPGAALAKEMHGRQTGNEVMRSFENEVFLMRELQHVNLVRFFGAQMKPPSLCIVMELMKGSLADLLYGKLSKGIEKTLPPCGIRTLSVLQDIAAGMCFLHSHSVIHRDLKSANVLFNRQLQVKLCDFAFSKFKASSGVNSVGVPASAAFESTVGTPAWMAPEVLRGDEYTMRADVYSYGVLVWETMARRQPWRELNGFQIISAVGMEGRTLKMPQGAPLLWWRVAAACWDRNPKCRPTFVQIDEVCRAAVAQLTATGGSSSSSRKLLPPAAVGGSSAPTAGDGGTGATAPDVTAAGGGDGADAVASAEAGAGMEAWRKVAADIEAQRAAAAARAAAADDGASSPDVAVYQSGLICEVVAEASQESEGEGAGGGSTSSSRKSESQPPEEGEEEEEDDDNDGV